MGGRTDRRTDGHQLTAKKWEIASRDKISTYNYLYARRFLWFTVIYVRYGLRGALQVYMFFVRFLSGAERSSSHDVAWVCCRTSQQTHTDSCVSAVLFAAKRLQLSMDTIDRLLYWMDYIIWFY